MYELCIIGFGISGIACAKEAKQNYINYIVLESNMDFGGCWSEKAYKFSSLQSGSNFYQFPDFIDDSLPLHPTKDQLLGYFKEVITNYNINNINYGCYVTKCNFRDEYWEINYVQNGKKIQIKSRYISVCTGLLNEPIIPKITQISKFAGEVYHSSQLKDIDIDNFINKKIIIIGNGATGLDLSKYLVKNNKITIIYRSPKLLSSRYVFNFPCNTIISRFFLMVMRKMPLFLYIIIIKSFWILVLNNYHELPSRKCTFKLINHNLDIQDLITNKKLSYLKTEIKKIDKNQIYIDNGDIIETDIIIFATGYKSKINFLEYDVNLIENYKHIINPKVKNCGFIGFNPAYNWMQVCYYQSKWFIKVIKNEIVLPNIETQYRNILMNKKISNENSMDYNDLTFTSFGYCDELYDEMYTNKLIKDLGYWLINPYY